MFRCFKTKTQGPVRNKCKHAMCAHLDQISSTYVKCVLVKAKHESIPRRKQFCCGNVVNFECCKISQLCLKQVTRIQVCGKQMQFMSFRLLCVFGLVSVTACRALSLPPLILLSPQGPLTMHTSFATPNANAAAIARFC